MATTCGSSSPVSATPSAVRFVVALWCRAILDAFRHGVALRFVRAASDVRRAAVPSALIRMWRQSAPRPAECWQALRTIRRSPWYSLTIITVIALSTSLSATVFAIVDGVLFKPLPYPEPENLYLATARRGDRSGGTFKHDEMALWRVAIPDLPFATLQIRGAAGTIGDGRMYGGIAVDGSFFEVLGQYPLVGGFAPDHFRPGAEPVAIISYRLWQRLFGGSHDAIGGVLPLVGAMNPTGRHLPAPLVVGILPRDFVFPEFANEVPDVIRPLALTAAERGDRNLSGGLAVIRRPEGMSVEALQSRIDAAVRAAQPSPSTGERILEGARLRALSEMALPFTKDFRTLALVASSLIALSCLGVAGLSSARARQRERDAVLRRSLGATAWDLFRQTVTEVSPTVLIGSALGFALAPVWLEFTLSLLPPQTGFVKPPSIDPRVAALVVGLAAATTLVVSLGVMRTVNRARLTASGSTTATGRVRGFGGAIVAGQTGLAFALTLGGALVVTSLWNLWQTNPGYDREKIAVVQVVARATNRSTIADDALRANDQLGRLPGAQAAGIFGARLLQHGHLVATVRKHPGSEPIELQQIAHGGDLTGVLELSAVRGRLPTVAEFARHDPVVVISERAAASLWPQEDPVGRTLFVGPNAVTVVGVVPDLQFSSLGDVRPRAAGQLHNSDVGYRQLTFLIRTSGQPELLAAAAKAELAAWRDQFDVLFAGTMSEALAESIVQRQFAAWAYGGFAVGALTIASVGIFGLVAMMTSLRTREMAVRLALGAASGGVVRLLLREQLVAVAIGLAAGGLVAAWSVGRAEPRVVRRHDRQPDYLDDDRGRHSHCRVDRDPDSRAPRRADGSDDHVTSGIRFFASRAEIGGDVACHRQRDAERDDESWTRELWCSRSASCARIREGKSSAQPGCDDQHDERQDVRRNRLKLDARQLTNQQLNVRMRIVVAESRADLPMPVGARTVAPAIPEPEAEPRQCRQGYGGEVPRPGSSPRPPGAVEENPAGVKDEEEDVESFVH